MDEHDAVFITDEVQIEYLQSRFGADFERSWKIPLSLHAYGCLLRRGLERVKSYIPFVDFDDCKHWYCETGLRHSRYWLRELGVRVEIERIDLAELDAPCQFLLFTHLRFLEKTAERMIEAVPEIRVFHVIQSRSLLEHEFYFDSDVSAAILCDVCERLGRPIEILEMEERPFYRFQHFAQRPITRRDLTAPGLISKNGTTARIGFVPATVTDAECIFASIGEIPAQAFLFPSTWDPGLLFGQQPRFSLADADDDWSERIGARLEKVYREFERLRFRSTLPDSIVRNSRLDYQFRYIICGRWRAYANMIHRGKQFVRDQPLDVFIHADHFTAEGAILSRLYRKKGTRVLIALHSNYPCDRNWASWRRKDGAMVPSKSAALRLRQISPIDEIFRIGDPELRRYRSLARSGSEAEMSGWKRSTAKGRKLLLVITNALELDSVPFVNLKQHFEAMALLAKVLESLKDRVAAAIRTKPGSFGEDPILYERLSGFYPDIRIPVESWSFSDCVRMADCIVGVNVATGGYYEIIRKGAPLIHFQNADVVSQQPNLPEEAITIIDDPAMLRSTIESVLFDESCRETLLQKQRSYAADDFETEIAKPGESIRIVLEDQIRKPSLRRRLQRIAGKKSDSRTSACEMLKESALKTSDAGTGSVDDVLCTPSGHCKAVGWAVDRQADRAAKAVHVFAGKRWIKSSEPSFERPDVAKFFGKSQFAKAGFVIYFRLANPHLASILHIYAETENGFCLLRQSF